MTAAQQSAHKVIRRIPEEWLARAEPEAAREVLRQREELIELFDRQKPHPVYEMVEARHLAGKPFDLVLTMLRQREDAIGLMQTDPFRHGWEPPMWRKMLLWLARKRLELPHDVLVFYVLGGIRSGKTDLGGKRMAQHVAAYQRDSLVGQYESWVWCLHQTEPRSKEIGQKRVYEYLPQEWRAFKQSRRGGGKLNYLDGSGFTNNMFSVGKRLCGFLFFGIDTDALQGAELTSAWSDELVPPAVVKIVNERLTTRAAQCATFHHQSRVRECLRVLEEGRNLSVQQVALLHLGVHLITFTPKDGWTQVVAEALNGAVTLEDEEAEALPILGAPGPGGEKRVVGFERVPRVKQCRRRNEMVFYIHTRDNPWGGYESVRSLSEGQNAETLRINLYGDVRKGWTGRFPGFRAERHVVRWSQVPRSLTIRHRVDLAGARPWFMLWVGTAPDGRRYVLDEWPREGDYIPGVGDPGPWAVPSAGTRKDGDAGPAQRPITFGYEDYMREIERVEKRLGAGLAAGEGEPGWESLDAIPVDVVMKAQGVRVWKRSMDSRLGHNPTPTHDGSTTIIDEMEKRGLVFDPAPGEHLDQGDAAINNALADLPGEATRAPGLFVAEHCLAVRYMLENYTGQDGAKGACKDPRDALVFELLDDEAGWLEGDALRVMPGMNRRTQR